jgi:hypothetical protein
VGASTDYYYNESWQVLEERTDGDAATVQWLWDARYIDAPVLRWRDADGDPQTDENGLQETVYFCNDANMNLTAAVAGNRRQPDREAGGDKHVSPEVAAAVFRAGSGDPARGDGRAVPRRRRKPA